MPKKPFVKRFFVELAPHGPRSSAEDVCTVVYNNTHFYGLDGGEEPAGDWEVLIILGLWWDGSKPKFTLYPNAQFEGTAQTMLSRLEKFYSPNQILISYAMDEYPDVGGSTVWVQRRSSPDPNWYDVWYSPLKDKWQCLDTPPRSWEFWGTMDNNMNVLNPVAKATPKPKAKVRSRARNKSRLMYVRLRPKAKAKAKAKAESMATE